MGTSEKARSGAAWELARRQHGLLTWRDLTGLGFGRRSIQHRLTTGRLHPVVRGIYAVGWPEITQERIWMAAVLACGDGAALSHMSAAALWEIAPPEGDDVVLTAPRNTRRPGLRVHIRALPAQFVTRHRLIPVTNPALTLIDYATEASASDLERAVNEADKRDRIDPETLRRELDRHAGRRGAPRLRSLLDRHTFRLSDEELERRFRPIAAAVGLPPPLTKVWVDEFEVDFFWPELDLVVETDGLRYHRTPAAQSRDARRFQAHVAAGRTALRFTHWQIARERSHVRGVLARTLGHLYARSGSSQAAGRTGGMRPA